jgi:hypothetical protein
MKLPTLNVDIAVNTKNFKRDLEGLGKAASKAIGGPQAGSGVAGKALDLIGNRVGISNLGGSMGMLYAGMKFTMEKAIAMTQSQARAIADGITAMDQYRSTGDIRSTGLDVGAASRLESAKQIGIRKEEATTGYMANFWAASMGDNGQMGGVLGPISDFAEQLSREWKGTLALTGGLLGGQGWSESHRRADVAYEGVKVPTDSERILALNTKILRESLS